MTTLKTPQPARHPEPTAKAQRLAHLLFEHPDPERTETFLRDFGLVTAERSAGAVFFRTAAPVPFCCAVRRGEKPRFVGVAFEVAERSDLVRLSALPGASAVEPLDTPGKGEGVRLRDPAGFAVVAVHGQEPYPAISGRRALPRNAPEAIERIDATQRPPIEPPLVHKLGHVVLETADYQAVSAFYTQHFGLIPSDVDVLPDGSPAVTFFRLDLGDTPADHHSLALAQGFASRFNHVAYEVTDLDAVAMGQRVLRERGYGHAWGVGRHELGSQIFDYWLDPWGAKHEHYCDGDLFRADVPTGIRAASPAGLAQWGPPIPASFLRPALTIENLTDLVRNVRRSPDLSLRKLLHMARLAG